MATRLLHGSEASNILPRCEVDEGKQRLPGFCFKSWQARKQAPMEFTPSPSGNALRGRLASVWCEKARGALFDFPGHDFEKEWETPLRFFIPMIDEGRSTTLMKDRSAGDCGEKTSLLLLAFSPFLGERATVRHEQRKREPWEKFEHRSTKC